MRIKVAVAVLVVAAMAATAVPDSSSAKFHWPTHLPEQPCGSFVSHYDGKSYTDVVSHSNGVSCRLATKVLKAFLEPGEELHQHGGPSSEEMWWTTNRFPKWKCFSGAGGGACLNGHRVAAYAD